jgi:hypothetical protein
MSTKKSKKSKKPEVEATRTEVRAVVVLEGIRVEDGRLVVGTTLPLPAVTIVENKKWPWGGWQVGYLEKQLAKDLARVAATAANLEHVRRIVGARTAEKAAKKPAAEVVLSAPLGDAVGKVPAVGQ